MPTLTVICTDGTAAWLSRPGRHCAWCLVPGSCDRPASEGGLSACWRACFPVYWAAASGAVVLMLDRGRGLPCNIGPTKTADRRRVDSRGKVTTLPDCSRPGEQAELRDGTETGRDKRRRDGTERRRRRRQDGDGMGRRRRRRRDGMGRNGDGKDGDGAETGRRQNRT